MSANVCQAPLEPTVAYESPALFEDPLTLVPRALTKLFSLWVTATYPFASVGKNLSMHYTTTVSRRFSGRIKIGNFVIIRRHAWINAVGLASPGDVKIVVDDYTVINSQCVISAKNRIHIEDHVMVSACSLIMDHNHAFEDVARPIDAQGSTLGGTIRIERGCWIGHGAAIICNQGDLVLGRNCVVAANALVTRSFPPYSVIIGNPGRLAKQFDPAKGVWVGATGRPMSADESV